MWMSYGHLIDTISCATKSFRMASKVAETYKSLVTEGEQQTRTLLGKFAFRNHIEILSHVGLYPLVDKSVKIIYGFDGRQALDLLGCRMVSVKPIEDYPIGTLFVISQIVYNTEGLLLNLDVLLDEEVIDIVGPFDTTVLTESFVYS